MSALDKALGIAEDALDDLVGAKHRLRGILVEELSLVDRAANKRRFLVVKNLEGDTQMADSNTTVSISAPVKEAVSKTLADVLEKLVVVANVVKSAQADEKAELLPTQLVAELKAVGDLLTDTVTKMSPPAAAGDLPAADIVPAKDEPTGPVAGTLLEVAEISKSLAQVACKMDQPDEGLVSKIQRLSLVLSGLADKYPSPAAKAAGEDKTVTTTKEPVKTDVAKDQATAISEIRGALTALTDRLEKVVQGITAEPTTKVDPAPAGEPAVVAPSPVTAQLDAVSGKIDAIFARLNDDGKTAADAVTKRLEALERENKDLKARVEKAFEPAPGRASRAVTTDDNKGKGGVVLPLFYNDPAHDSEMAKTGADKV